MAKKKNRNDKSRPKAQPPQTENIQASGSITAQPPEQSPGPLKQPKSNNDNVGRKKSGVSVATTVIGMLLTLILGLYIGSLLPGLFMADKSAPAIPQAPPQAAKPADPMDKMDPALKQRIAALEKSAAANPASAPDWINLGNIYFDAQQPQKAIDAYEHALAIAPNNPDVLTDLGIMYRELGNYEKAVQCFRKAVEIDPGHQNALFNAGVVLSHDLKLKAEAAAMWEQLLSLNPQAHAPNGVPLSDMVRELRQ